jgi:glycine cleavage system aminomethyltransferase T
VKDHVQLNEAGQVASEGVVYRVGEEEFIYTGGGGDWALWQAPQGSWDMEIGSITANLFIFEVEGPQSLFALERATGEILRDIALDKSRHASIGGCEVRVLRTGISGELGYELHGSADDAGAVWAAVLEAGEEFGIRQLGMRSLLVQHIEAGIATSGLDFLPASIVSLGAPKLLPGGGMPGGNFVPKAITDFSGRRVNSAGAITGSMTITISLGGRPWTRSAMLAGRRVFWPASSGMKTI